MGKFETAVMVCSAFILGYCVGYAAALEWARKALAFVKGDGGCGNPEPIESHNLNNTRKNP